jgi:formamidopyrimidine-DNA glycosylase
MPELPDVEAYRRFFAQHAAGRTVRRTLVTDEGILRNASARALDDALRGHRFEEPGRHGKWLIASTTGPVVLFHFGMTGDLGWGENDEARHRHDRVIFELDRGELRYRNMRKLGGLWLAHDQDEVRAVTGRLGPDALGIDRRAFRRLLRGRRSGVKALLMNQSVLAGVGNLVADETLWRARLHPAARVEALSEDEVARVHRAMRDVLRISVERYDRVPSPRGWLNHVRGRPDAACPRCGTPLDRATVAGRTTYFCPRCQPYTGS